VKEEMPPLVDLLIVQREHVSYQSDQRSARF
jgi:hypothetical protein